MAELSLICPSTTATSGSGALAGAGSVTIISGSPVTIISGAGVTPVEHENIDSLVHQLSEDTYTEIFRNPDGTVASVHTLVAPAGIKVRTVSVSRDGSGTVTGTLDIQYDPSGVEIQRLITTITRDGSGTVTSVTTDEIP